MIWVEAEDIILIHSRIVQVSGGSAGLRDRASLESAIAAPLQSFDGHDLFPTEVEKIARLGYGLAANHAFADGNKRIAAAIFLYFLDKNEVLFDDAGNKRIDDHTLVALTIMIAESRPEEKEMMISVIMNCMDSK